jgi:hypothetical protein
MGIDEWDALIRSEENPENFRELRTRATGYKPLGAKDGVEVKELAETGWSVIFFGASYERAGLANTWMAANDAQWYTIVGDPAVRLPVVDETAT